MQSPQLLWSVRKANEYDHNSILRDILNLLKGLKSKKLSDLDFDDDLVLLEECRQRPLDAITEYRTDH